MQEKHIPRINQDFDLSLLLHVIRKSLLWIVFFLLLTVVAIFLIVRYTNPQYQTKSVIQFTKESENPVVLDERLNPYNTVKLAKEIEQLRSPVFLQRVADNLPLGVSYYSKGNILDFETYRGAPFTVEIDTPSSGLYGVEFVVSTTEKNGYELTTKDGIFNKERKIYGVPVSYKGGTFRIISKETHDNLHDGGYYFIVNNPQFIVADLSKDLSINVLSEAAKTVEISYSGNNPGKVAEVTNAVAKEFGVFNTEKKQESAIRVIEYIDNTLGLLSSNLSENEKKLGEYSNKENIDPYLYRIKQDKGISSLTSFEQQEARLRYDLTVLEKVKQRGINTRSDVVNISALVAGTSLEGALRDVLQSLTQTFALYDDYLYSSPESSPIMNRVKHQLESQKRAYVEALFAVEGVFKERLTEIKAEKEKINLESITDTSNIEASMLKRIRDINEKFFNQLIDKKAEYSIAKEGFSPEYQILEFASIPAKPYSPNTNMIVIVGVLLWLGLSILLVVSRYMLTDEIIAVSDISKYTEVPILGTISRLKEVVPLSHLVVDKKPKGRIAENFRTIRTNLQFIKHTPGSKIISLTSTISGEGKTFVSINLGGILAFGGSKVVIIDCDMRKPKIHMGFEVDNAYGMSTLLIGKGTLEEAIRHSQMPDLHFITAGPIPPNPSELLLGKEMDQLLDTLKKMYDYIIVDNPPAGLVSDAIVNMQRADYPIYVFRSNYSRRYFINNLKRIKDENRISSISCVLNSVETDAVALYGQGYGNYGYGYGSYGYGYYEEDEESGFWHKVRNVFDSKTKKKK